MKPLSLLILFSILGTLVLPAQQVAPSPARAQQAFTLGQANPGEIEARKQKLKQSFQAWQKTKKKYAGNYSYKKYWSSWVGFGHETTVVVENNKVVSRSFRSFSGKPVVVAPGQLPKPDGKTWTERGPEVGKNKEGHPAKTLDELYAEAKAIVHGPLPPFNRMSLRTDKNGLLLACYIQDTRIADDAPTKGVNITSITLGKKKEAPDKKPKGLPTYKEWIAGGKKLPAGMVFIGGSPWFNERTGKKRQPKEVYDMIYGKKGGPALVKPKPRPPLIKSGVRKAFPKHWGNPPRRQTRDRRPLPDGYGTGSGKLAKWIQENLDRDKKADKKVD
jgi:hypothetical protein